MHSPPLSWQKKKKYLCMHDVEFLHPLLAKLRLLPRRLALDLMQLKGKKHDPLPSLACKPFVNVCTLSPSSYAVKTCT